MLELSEIIKQKKSQKSKFLKEISAPKSTRAVIFNALENSILSDFIENACAEIDVICIKEINDENIFALDAIISDNTTKEKNLQKFLENFVTPILPTSSEFKLEQFNPMKFSGEGFLFAENKNFLVFEQICKMLENLNYPGDKRVLIKNLANKFTKN